MLKKTILVDKYMWRKIMIRALTQEVDDYKRRFTWARTNGSVYITDGDRPYVSVSSNKLQWLARTVLGPCDEKSRVNLASYHTWTGVSAYDFADLLFQIDKELTK